MPKLPFMKFYPADWIAATRALSLENRGKYMTLLCHLWINTKTGQMTFLWDDLATLWNCDVTQALRTVTSLKLNGCIGTKETEVEGGLKAITILQRRIRRDKKTYKDNAVRQQRHRNKTRRLSNAFSNAKITPKKSEVRSQKSDKDKDVIADRPQTSQIGQIIPADGKPLTDVQKVVLVYKMASGYEQNDASWDKAHFARYTKPAKALIDFLGSSKDAANCVQDVYERLTAKGLTVTMETVMKHSADWKKDQQEKTAGVR